MRSRRIICFLLGIWVGVSALLTLASYQSFNTVETVLKEPPDQASRIFKTLGPSDALMLLRYTAGREHIGTFETWEDIQFAIGLLLMAMLFLEGATRMLSPVPLGMILIVTFMHFKITPELGWLNHIYAFGSTTAESQTRAQFWRLHAVYGTLDVLKDVLGLGLVIFLSSQHSTKQVRRSRRRGPVDRLEETVRP